LPDQSAIPSVQIQLGDRAILAQQLDFIHPVTEFPFQLHLQHLAGIILFHPLQDLAQRHDLSCRQRLAGLLVIGLISPGRGHNRTREEEQQGQPAT